MKIFHCMANARRNGNFISSVTISGICLEKEEELKEGIFSHFSEMFKEPKVGRPDIATELFKSIDSMDREVLEGPFSEEEVTSALADLGGDKAPWKFSLARWVFFGFLEILLAYSG